MTPREVDALRLDELQAFEYVMRQELEARERANRRNRRGR